MTDSTDEVDWYDGPDEEPFEESPKRRENKQWLRFAEAAVSTAAPKGFKESESWDHAMENIGVIACDIADAMLEEAKKRGRV